MTAYESIKPTGRVDIQMRNTKELNIINSVNHQATKMNKRGETKTIQNN
jgi:hypothetical protein